MLRDSLGCMSEALRYDQALAAGDLCFFRKSSAAEELRQVVTPASERGFLAGVSLTGGHRRRIFQPNHADTYAFDVGSVYLRNFQDDYKADLSGTFDFVLIELSPAFIERTAMELGRPASLALRNAAAQHDPVLAHLAQALLPALSRPGGASRLFVDQLGHAIGTHLVEQYGGIAAARLRGSGRLSPRILARAQDYLTARLDDGSISVADVADACQLSRSHFSRAFRQSTGKTPHEWLLERRLEQALALLRTTELPIAGIAVSCGFADQSHLTRSLSKKFGVTPGAWRTHRE
ncbi:AraC family transcriptional regulator [Cupriavidus sp. WKF15]|uniref:helix-turn-helix transcriptional regulator n=1 Tax=Cupriavidus sp. WKF15 TaxID=3032282 RepID=UPI0023E31E28|nr:AraC family transcriptional regulator [Cupriavidus sp. WKF15]WER47521.1 AraC family transcriptional regulator [Cupriavidus sp. WKF15]